MMAVSGGATKRTVLVDWCHCVDTGGGQFNELDIEALGQLIQMPDGNYVLEFVVEGNPTSKGGNQYHVLKIRDNDLSLVVNHKRHILGQVFKQGVFSAYEVIHSSIGKAAHFRIKATALDIAVNAEGGVIEVYYDVYSGARVVCHCELEVFIR